MERNRNTQNRFGDSKLQTVHRLLLDAGVDEFLNHKDRARIGGCTAGCMHIGIRDQRLWRDAMAGTCFHCFAISITTNANKVNSCLAQLQSTKHMIRDYLLVLLKLESTSFFLIFSFPCLLADVWCGSLHTHTCRPFSCVSIAHISQPPSGQP